MGTIQKISVILFLVLILPVLTNPIASIAAGPVEDTSPENIFPPDDRFKITPDNTEDHHRAMVKIYAYFPNGLTYTGSGCVISDFHVLTVAHVIYDTEKGQWAENVKVVPMMRNGEEPLNHAWAVKKRALENYLLFGTYYEDMALLTLDRNLGKSTGCLDMASLEPSDPIYSGNVTTAGYPGDKNYGLDLYGCYGDGYTATRNLHYYYLDVYGGQSGSPVYFINETGTHVLSLISFSQSEGEPNMGPRLNEKRIETFRSWMEEDVNLTPGDLPDIIDRGMTINPVNMDWYSTFFGGVYKTKVVPGVSYFEIYCQVKNAGMDDAGPFNVTFFISEDKAFSADDMIFGHSRIDSLAVSETREVQWDGIFPPNVSDGNYYAGWFADSNEEVNELDEENNVVIFSTFTLEVESFAPDTTLSFGTEAFAENWFDEPVEISLEATDAGGWVEETHYSLDGRPETPYTVPLVIEEEGPHTIRFWSVDNNENVEVANEVHFGIDADDPTITIDKARITQEGDIYYLDINFTSSDGTSGVHEHLVTVDGNSHVVPGNATGCSLASSSETVTVKVVARDKAGNTATETRQIGSQQDLTFSSDPLWTVFGMLALFFTAIIILTLIAGLIAVAPFILLLATVLIVAWYFSRKD